MRKNANIGINVQIDAISNLHSVSAMLKKESVKSLKKKAIVKRNSKSTSDILQYFDDSDF